MVGKALEALQMRNIENGNFVSPTRGRDPSHYELELERQHSLVGLYFRLDIRFTSQSSMVLKGLWRGFEDCFLVRNIC